MRSLIHNPGYLDFGLGFPLPFFFGLAFLAIAVIASYLGCLCLKYSTWRKRFFAPALVELLPKFFPLSERTTYREPSFLIVISQSALLAIQRLATPSTPPRFGRPSRLGQSEDDTSSAAKSLQRRDERLTSGCRFSLRLLCSDCPFDGSLSKRYLQPHKPIRALSRGSHRARQAG